MQLLLWVYFIFQGTQRLDRRSKFYCKKGCVSFSCERWGERCRQTVCLVRIPHPPPSSREWFECVWLSLLCSPSPCLVALLRSLVALGACTFTLVSQFGFVGRADQARVAASVASGVGFIGAGVR